MDTITLNGYELEVQEVQEVPMVKFKFVKNWCKISDAFIPNVTALEWLLSIGEKGFWDHSEKKAASRSLLRRWVEQGIIRFNGKILKPNDMLDFPILSVVLFPKTPEKYTTLF